MIQTIDVSTIGAVFAGLSTLLGVWLAHRRKKADEERREFERAMSERFGLQFKVSDWSKREKPKGDGR